VSEKRGHGHGNKVRQPRRPDRERWPSLSIRKVAASSVPFGESISRNGSSVWGAYCDGELIAVAATRAEARFRWLKTQHIREQ
jgi:hypothetical protein